MENSAIFTRYPELKEFIYQLRHELRQNQRPANEVVLDDQEVMRILKISKRKLQYLKSKGAIPYHYLEPDGKRTYYFLIDILDIIRENRVESIFNQRKIK